MTFNEGPRRPTLRDVAEHANVSFKTVSRVVNDEGSVSDALALRVNDAINELGYRPDERARNLRQRGGTTGTIGFILVDVSNPFFSALLRGIEDVARERGSLVLAGSNDGLESRQQQLIEAFIARRVDGFIVVPAGPDVALMRAELERGTPVVFLDLEPDLPDVDLVRSDHYGGAFQATTHLLRRGHRDIAFFGDDRALFSAGQRLMGFLDAMNSYGIEVPEHRIVCDKYPPEAWHDVVVDHIALHGPPTALFTAQNFITIGAAVALHDANLHHQVAHIGFDDVELAAIVEPGISVVPQHPHLLGRQCAELLFRRIDGDSSPPARLILGNPIIERGSGEIPPLPTDSAN